MTLPNRRTAEGLILMLEDLEEIATREDRLGRELRALRLHRRRLEASVRAGVANLGPARSDQLRKRLAAVTRRKTLADARSRKTEREAILHFLAVHEDEIIKVGEVACHLEREGFDIRPTYCSETLKRFEKQGIVRKVSYGRYETNWNHPEIMRIHSWQLDNWEAFQDTLKPRAYRENA